MAFSTEFVMGAGGGVDITTIPGKTFSLAETTLHTFTLTQASIVAVDIAPLPETSTGRWGAPSPYLIVGPVSGPVTYGHNIRKTALHVHDSTTSGVGDRPVDNRWLSLSGVFPPGDYSVIVSSANSGRSYTIGESTLTVIPI